MRLLLSIGFFGAAGLFLSSQATEGVDEMTGPITYSVHPIGHVRQDGDTTYLEIEEQYADGLLGLDGFSHVQVFWWFHKNDTPVKRRILQVHPRGNPDNPLQGVFATRSPVRPNLIALTTCRIDRVEGNRVYIQKIDAFADTPILDLKPYIPGLDRMDDVDLPEWIRRGRGSGK